MKPDDVVPNPSEIPDFSMCENSSVLSVLSGRIRPRNGEAVCSVVFGGDFSPGDIGCEIAKAGKGTALSAEIAPFFANAEIRMVQWETPIVPENASSPIVKTGPHLQCTSVAIPLIQDLFNVALLANNHTGDHGPRNLLYTISKLNQAGIQTVGAGKIFREATTQLRYLFHNRTVTIFNLCENEFGIAGEHEPGTAGEELFRDLSRIRAATSAGELVLVIHHGGNEHNPYPSPGLQAKCRAWVDAGAALVINCHPHCPQGIETYCGVPIVYSPGNLYFPKQPGKYPEKSMWWTGYLTRFEFDESGVFQYELLPYQFDNEKIHCCNKQQTEAFRNYLKQISEPLASKEELTRLFEIWSAVHGKRYLRESLDCIRSGWSDNLGDAAVRRDLMGMRNLFCCESHCDLLRCFLRLVETGRVESAASEFDRIRSFQTPTWFDA